MPNTNQEDREAAKAAFDKAKGSSTDTASLFEVVDALRELGISAQSDELYNENNSWDVNFERFCEIYSKKKDEKEKKELNQLVIQSFEALGGKENQQGVVDVNKLTEIFKFYELDIEPEDFLGRAGLDLSSTILFEDYQQIFDLSGARQ
ncbi:hypothetical protein M9Y10_022297 [Tritrichomonas musculus]|uniref:EF-hand domain-containing protein n=1 Tax=Tritrichomonas musculus TaxID=1915356 RepID=A0ABR2KSQ9_9EUKA